MNQLLCMGNGNETKPQLRPVHQTHIQSYLHVHSEETDVHESGHVIIHRLPAQFPNKSPPHVCT